MSVREKKTRRYKGGANTLLLLELHHKFKHLGPHFITLLEEVLNFLVFGNVVLLWVDGQEELKQPAHTFHIDLILQWVCEQGSSGTGVSPPS